MCQMAIATEAHAGLSNKSQRSVSEMLHTEIRDNKVCGDDAPRLFDARTRWIRSEQA
jgi:hypothetical protein